MKILLVYDGIYPDRIGGVERRNLALARELINRGHSASLAGFVADRSALPADVPVIDLGRPAILYDRRGRRRLRHTAKYGAAISRLPIEGFDVIETTSLPFSHLPFLHVRARRMHIPLVVTWHEFWGPFWSTQFPRLASIFLPLEELAALHMGDRLVAVSRLTADRLRRLSRRDVALVPNGIDVAAIHAAAESVPSGPALLFVGRLIADKRIDLLIRALALIPHQADEPLLRIVGDGPELGTLRRLAADIGVDDRILWSGRLRNDRDVWRAIGACRIMVHPSRREGFGIVALEALAAGRPVITCHSPDSALPELVEDRVNGLCVPPEPSALADAILELSSDEELRIRLSAGATTTTSRYDWKAVARSFEDVLASAVEANAAGE